MKKLLCIFLVLAIFVGVMPVMSLAAVQENNFTATNMGHRTEQGFLLAVPAQRVTD